MQNIYRAEQAAIELWRRGWIVLCPHKNTAFFGGACDDQIWIDGGLELLERCDAIFMLKEWQGSEGAQKEYSRAVQLNMPIFHEENGYPEVP